MRQLTDPAEPHVGFLLRQWRTKRKLSQMELSGEADISTRHLSFIETGRALPSRETLQQLCAGLSITLREQNRLFLKAGYAPPFAEKSLEHPSLDLARAAMNRVLAGFEPNPAIVVDRHWNLLSANRGVPRLLEGVSSALLNPPINVLRLSFHPDGLTSRIANRRQWQKHLLERLRAQISISEDARLKELREELLSFRASGDESSAGRDEDLLVPLRLRVGTDVLSFLSTTMIFGSPLEVTLSELAIECFFPLDEKTKSLLAS